MRVTVLLLLALLAGCAAAAQQLDATNVNGCIKKNCTDPDASAYQSCEATCRRTYAR